MIFDKYWGDNVYGFDQQLIASKGVLETCDVGEILRTRIPGCVKAVETDKATDRKGVDWWALLKNGQKIGVDVKHRQKDCQRFGNDDVALETWSVLNQQVGWTRDHRKLCGWVLWVWGDTGRFLLLPFPAVCAVFSENWQRWGESYQRSTQTTRETKRGPGWQSECVFVPRAVLVESVVDWFSGSIA